MCYRLHEIKVVHLITLLFVLGKETVGIETNDTEHSSDRREPEDEDKSRDHCTSASNGKYRGGGFSLIWAI